MYVLINRCIIPNNLKLHQTNHLKDLTELRRVSMRGIWGVWVFSVGFYFLLLGCNSKPEIKEEITPFFTINGDSLNRDMVGIPDSLDLGVYRAQSGVPLIFKGSFSESPNEDYWVVDGIERERGKNQLTFTFEFPGMYQVKHCMGSSKCATRFVFVPHDEVEESPQLMKESPLSQEPEVPTSSPGIKKSPVMANGGSGIIAPKSPVKPNPDSNGGRSEPKTGDDQDKLPVDNTPVPKKTSPNPPDSFKNSAVSGIASSLYKTDCALWTDNSVIKLRPDDWCELHSAVVFGNAPGKLRITLTDGKKVNESMTVTLNAGKTSFSFAGLEALLQPGVEYTLKISTLEVDKNQRPKIGNASSCSPGNAKGAPVLAVNYGADYSLFDLKYKY